MISIAANILLYSYSADSPFHTSAKSFLEELSAREDVALSEFILTEFYLLLRNPGVLQNPPDASAAAAVIASYRKHPRWRTLGFPPRSRELHGELWISGVRSRISTFPAFHAAEGCTSLRMASAFSRSARMNS